MQRFLRYKRILYLLALLALLVGAGRVVAQSSGSTPKESTVTVATGHVLIVADDHSVVAHDAGETVNVKTSRDTFAVLLASQDGNNQYCALIGRAKSKGWKLTTTTPLSGWTDCDKQSSSKIVPSTGNGAGSSSQAASGGQDCTASPTQHHAEDGDWNIGNDGAMIVNFWTNRGTDQGNYKLWLDAGSYTLPGGGTAFLYPKGCEDVARQQFGDNPLPATDLNQIQANVAAGNSGDQSGSGNQPQQDCTAQNEKHDPDGNPWTVTSDGPMVVNVYVKGSADESVYKFDLPGGQSYTFPANSGGDVSYYPQGCEGAAGQGFDQNSNAPGNWDYVQSLGSAPATEAPGQGGQQDCTATTDKNDPNRQPWTVSNGGPMIVNVYVAGSSDTQEYKFLLPAGSDTFPANSGGDVSYYPAGCDSQAGADFDQDGYPKGDWDHVQSLGSTQATEVPTQVATQPSQDCTATGIKHDPDGNPWTISNDGPLVVNVYVAGSSDTTEYKFDLPGGQSYTFPANSGGDASLFPQGCDDAAGAAYDNDGYTPGDWDHVQSLSATPATEAPTQDVTQPATEAPTDAATQPPTQAPTDPPATQGQQNTINDNSSKIVPAASPQG